LLGVVSYSDTAFEDNNPVLPASVRAEYGDDART